jgi:hypothetical protein
MCLTPSWKISEETQKRAAWLTQELMLKYGIPLDNIIRHYDVTGKLCPESFVDETEWGRFKARLTVPPMKGVTVSGTPIIAKTEVSIDQMIAWARNKNADQTFIDLAPAFYSISNECGVDACLAYCQSAKETAYGRYGGVLDESYKNPCGLKTSGGGSDTDASAHMRFPTWEAGIRAQVDHLALYAGQTGYPKQTTTDPRHFPYLFGTAQTVESLGGKWAPSPDYGTEIVGMMIAVAETETVRNADQPSEWATESWEWGKENGITDGTNPRDYATREQVVAMINRTTLKGDGSK